MLPEFEQTVGEICMAAVPIRNDPVVEKHLFGMRVTAAANFQEI